MGPMGQLASLLFKAEKANMQTKNYLGKAPVSQRPYRDNTNERLQEMLDRVASLLDAHARGMDISWGWSKDDAPDKPLWILCVDLPTGLVTYRLPYRHLGPDYKMATDSDSYNSDRITEFCAGVMEYYWMQAVEESWELPIYHNPQSGD